MDTKRNADGIQQLMRSPVWADDGVVKLYLYCLAMASRNQYCWRGLQLQPGDIPLSERKTARARFGSRDKLRRRMRMLEVQGMKRFVKCFFNLLTDSPAQLISKD